MKNTGMVRAIDTLGRIVIPKEIRKSHGIDTGAFLEIYEDEGIICLKPLKLQCVICGSTDEANHIIHNGVHVCKECLNGFADDENTL